MDAEKYRTVVIGGETWMAENLNFETSNSWCYRNDASNCDAYGRLYTWDAAMSACPAGWRLPNDSDWRTLTNAISNAVGINAGTKLKSTSGWKSRGNGNDEIGFSALPGGYRNTDGSFGFVGHYGRWWSATEHDASRARYQYMLYSNSNVRSGWYGKSLGFSVRCLMDERP